MEHSMRMISSLLYLLSICILATNANSSENTGKLDSELLSSPLHFENRNSVSAELSAQVDDLVTQVKSLPRDFNLTDKMVERIWWTLHTTLTKPDCPLSGYRVGTLVVINGEAFPGVNNEDPTIFDVACGERCAMWGAQARIGKTGERTLIEESYVFAVDPNNNKVEVGISSSCGLCRQTYVNRGNPDIFFIYNGQFLKRKALELLPFPYKFLPNTCVKVEKREFKGPDDHLKHILSLEYDGVNKEEITSQLQNVFRTAIQASQIAYAPYYQVREGVGYLVESPLYEDKFKIFDYGNYQNASYGASQGAISGLLPHAKYEFAKLARDKGDKSVKLYPKIIVLFAFNRADELILNVPPSGPDLQVAAEEEGGLKAKFYFIYNGKLVGRTGRELLPNPFSFIDIVSAKDNG
jgi:cytidine deaminase